MDAARSDRACNLCRQRRVRCDKTLPTCKRCTKYGLPCPGYPTRQRFVDQSSMVRNKLADDNTSSAQRSTTSTNSPSTATNRSEHSNTPIRDGMFTNSAESLRASQSFVFRSENMTVGPSNQSSPHVLTSTSNRTSQPQILAASLIPNPSPEQFDAEDSMQQLLEDSGSGYFDLDIESYYANGNNACGFFPGIPVALPQHDEVEMLDSSYDARSLSYPHDGSPANGFATNSEDQDTDPNKREVALLVHLFVESLAPWMDLFDIDAYFTRVLPRDASLNILLQSALAAVAAKQTARYVMTGHVDPTSRLYAYIMATYQNVSSNEWFYKAACYYDRGISHLRARLQQSAALAAQESGSGIIGRNQASAMNNSPFSTVSQSPNSSSNKHSEIQHLYSAISVFSLYESLDDCFATSSQHLPGFLALFDRNNTLSLPQSLTAGRAAFWYFARKEALSSYAHHVKPRIDPDNMTVWVSAGLPLAVYHFLSTGEAGLNSSNLEHTLLEDDNALPCTLIWILTKVIDLIAPSENTSSHSSPYRRPVTVYDTAGPGYQSVDQVQAYKTTWNKLRELLVKWYNRRPSLLIPYAVVETNSPHLKAPRKPLRTAFFTCPTAAASLQLYHFIQVLLLTNQPTNRRDQGSRLRMLKDNASEVEYHSREICAIALGHQPLAIQRQMSHPLQLASAYFEMKEDRDAIYEVLREIATETSSPIELPI